MKKILLIITISTLYGVATAQGFKDIHKYDGKAEGSNIGASLDTQYDYISIVGDNEIDGSIKTIAIFKNGSGHLVDFATALLKSFKEETIDLTIGKTQVSIQGIKVMDEFSIVIVSTEGGGVYTTIDKDKALAFAKSVSTFKKSN